MLHGFYSRLLYKPDIYPFSFQSITPQPHILLSPFPPFVFISYSVRVKSWIRKKTRNTFWKFLAVFFILFEFSFGIWLTWAVFNRIFWATTITTPGWLLNISVLDINWYRSVQNTVFLDRPQGIFTTRHYFVQSLDMRSCEAHVIWHNEPQSFNCFVYFSSFLVLALEYLKYLPKWAIQKNSSRTFFSFFSLRRDIIFSVRK